MAQVVKETTPKKNFQSNDTPEFNKTYTAPKQSANVLFQCMRELDYLKAALKNQAIMPRYYPEKVDYLNISGIDKIAFPMSCFCDIHLKKLEDHMFNYGDFAIGLSKEWGITKGIQPIQYINEGSALRKDFSSVFNLALTETDEKRKEFNFYNDYLLTSLLFMKPLEGEMPTVKGDKYRNFHDEKEWRFVPNIHEVNTDLPLVIPPEQMNQKSIDAYSDSIQKRPELWLKFELSKIKYIIVNDQSSKKELITFLKEHKTSESIDELLELSSKILVYSELKEDW